MRKPRSALVLLLLFGVGVSLAVPAEDSPETAYDESETLPYEGTPLFSITVPQATDRMAKVGVSRDSQAFFHSWMKHSMSGRISMGDYAGALKESQEALRLNPNQINAYLNQGQALLALNRRDEVKQMVRQAQAHGLDMNDLHILLYDVAFLENDRKEMEAQLAPYLARTDEEAFDALVAQSRTEAYSGRLKSALVSLERGLEIVRGNDHELAAQVKDAEALGEAEFGNPAEARQAASAALTLSTGRNARLFTALALARAGDPTRAQVENAQPVCVPVSLAIRNHSLRC